MTSLSDEVKARVERLELPWNAYGVDPYGIAKKDLAWFFTGAAWLYRNYFRVNAVGTEHVPGRGRVMLVGNHSGGVALDGLMVIASMFLEKEPPRLAQGMADKFLNRTAFASRLTQRLGHFTGLPEHAVRLLEDERMLMVFPEGTRGTAKLYWERHSLVHFGPGFVRLALQTRTPIVPFGFVGGGEAIPTMGNSITLGKLFGLPYVPFTPWLFPLPLPVRLEVRFGAPMRFQGDGNEDDATIEDKVEQVRHAIADLIEEGRNSLRSA